MLITDVLIPQERAFSLPCHRCCLWDVLLREAGWEVLEMTESVRLDGRR